MFEEIDRKFAVRIDAAPPAVVDDAEIRGLFQQWIKAERAAEEDIEDDERCERCAVAEDLSLDIGEAPPAGPAGLAIKIYLAAHWHFGGRPGGNNGTALDDAFVWGTEELILGGAIADAVRFAPELQPLVADFLASWREALRDYENEDEE